MSAEDIIEKYISDELEKARREKNKRLNKDLLNLWDSIPYKGNRYQQPKPPTDGEEGL